MTDATACATPGADAHDSGAYDAELIHEAITMALYVSLSLIAVLIALPIVGDEDNRVQAAITVMVTAVGLVLAHHVAFRLSTRLVNGGLLTPESVRALKAQALGGLPVAVIAAIPVFLFGEDIGEDVAIFLLLAFVALMGYRSARYTSGKARSFLYVCGLVGVISVVMLVKLIAGH